MRCLPFIVHLTSPCMSENRIGLHLDCTVIHLGLQIMGSKRVIVGRPMLSHPRFYHSRHYVTSILRCRWRRRVRNGFITLNELCMNVEPVACRTKAECLQLGRLTGNCNCGIYISDCHMCLSLFTIVMNIRSAQVCWVVIYQTYKLKSIRWTISWGCRLAICRISLRILR